VRADQRSERRCLHARRRGRRQDDTHPRDGNKRARNCRGTQHADRRDLSL